MMPFLVLHEVAVASPVPLSNVADLARMSVSNHTCVITTSGDIKCWGKNINGKLGDGSTTDRSAPVEVIGLSENAVAVATGGRHTCAVLTNGAVKCWGSNSDGQLGDNTQIDRLAPVDVNGLDSEVTAIAAGNGHTCALLKGGGVKCWGNNEYGQLGDNTTINRLTPVKVNGLNNGVTAIATGGRHSCALLSSGGMMCWGANSAAQLGIGVDQSSANPYNYNENPYAYILTAFKNYYTPVDVIGLNSGVIAIATGGTHSCALLNSGLVKCWGDSTLGQAGTTPPPTVTYLPGEPEPITSYSIPYILEPTEVSGLGNEVKAIATGEGHTCALLSSGGIKCLGYNDNGQLGDGTYQSSPTPVEVVGLTGGVTTIATGSTHTCALLNSGGVKCWGDGFESSSPVDVLYSEGVDTTFNLPQIANIMPTTTTIGTSVIFTITGTHLKEGMELTVTDCPTPVELPGGSDTQRQFQCTPTGVAGTKAGIVRDSNGEVLYNFNLEVSDSQPLPMELKVPTDLTATATGTQVTLHWTDHSDNETGFKILREGVELTTVATNLTQFVDTGLTCGTSHTYIVKATNATGDSTPATTNVTLPPCLYTLTLKTQGTGKGTIGGTQAGQYPQNTSISLTAQPDQESEWVGWTPATCGNPFALTANTTCIAEFDLNRQQVEEVLSNFCTLNPDFIDCQVFEQVFETAKKCPPGSTDPVCQVRFYPVTINDKLTIGVYEKVQPNKTVPSLIGLNMVFMAYGDNLTDGTKMAVENCENMTLLPNGTSSRRDFSCKQWGLPGDRKGIVKDHNGVELYQFDVKVLYTCKAVKDLPLKECETLDNIYQGTQGGAWKNAGTNKWLVDVSPCGWAGITCANGHVTHLRLADNNLTGTMPDICPLAELKELDISNNRLTGNLPNLCQSGLEVANLSNNQFSGTLPDLTGLTQLKTLGLANNQLEGKVPDFSQFPNLKVSLGGNQLLSGTLSVTQPIPEVVVPQGSSPMTIDLTPYFKDTSGGPITYRMSFNSNANVVTTSLQNNNLLLTFGGPGLSEITVEARDSIGMTVQSTFKVTVNQAVQMAVYTPSCSNEGETIESSCVGQEQVLKVSKIEEQASISNIIIDSSIENHGWISNSKVTPNGSLTGGTLTGYISNEGTITNVDFVGAELKGGMLSGKIVNNSKIGGVIKDVKLDKDTVLQGGNIEGNIEGNCDSPALLEDVTVKTGSTLSCVVLGKNVKLEGDVKQDRVTVKEQTQGGNGSTPEVAKVTQMDIGNVTVYADNIEPAKGSKSSFTATGNVAIGRVGGYKILQINGTGLELDYLQNSVKTQGKGDVVALDIKASPSSSPKNMPIYAGGFEIDASENPPKLDIKAQDREGSILELEPLRAFEGSTFFETMTAPTEISIETNKVTVKNIAIQFSKAVGFPLEFGDIVLSQENDSTFEVTLSFADLFKVAGEVPVIVPPIPIRRDSLWTVSNLEGSYDLLTGKLTMSGEFQIPYTVDGLFAKLGFTTNPMELDHLELALLTNGRFPSIPPSPPSPFGAKLEKVGFAVKEIANPKPLVLSGYGDFSLTDAAHVSDAIEKWGLKVITARVDLTIDFDGKVILSAQKAKLLEHFDLGSLSLTLGNPVDLSGKITMFDMVSGELNLAGEILPNPQAPPAPPAPPMLEFRGFIEGVMQLPAYTPIIGKMELGAVKVKVTLRIATTGLHYALFKAGIRYGDEELAVSIFARDVLDPHISLHGFDKLCPDFIGKWIWCPDSVIQIRSNPGLRKNEPITVVNLDQDYNLVVMVVTSEKETPAVTLKLPNGNLQTMENTAKLSVSTQNDVAVVNNPVTHQTSYFLKKPMQGSYVVEVTNPADLGDYNVQLLLPSKKPTVTLTSQPQDQEWDGKSPISIDWSASDPNKDAKVSLYYGVSNTDNRGMTIAYDLPSTTSSYQWTPSPETPAGHYYVYVKIDDDKNMPVYSYSVGKITINNPTAPAAPEEVKLVAGDGNIAVSWQLSDETNLLGYRVYVSDTVGDNVFEKSIGVGLQTTHIIEGLTNGKTYEVAVSAINDKGLVSLLSPPQTQTPLGDSDAGDSDVVSTTAIDALGLFTKTNSHFKGGISVNGEPELPNVTHTTSDEISVIGEMTTDFAHLGKVIDWLVIGIYKPTPTSTPQLYMLEEPEVPIEQRAQAVPVIRPWDGDPKHLVAMKKAVILRPTQRLNLWQGQLSATGEVQIYYGYRLPDGTIVLNPQPLEDVITE